MTHYPLNDTVYDVKESYFLQNPMHKIRILWVKNTFKRDEWKQNGQSKEGIG